MPDGFSFAEALQPAQPKGFSFAEALAPAAPDPLADSEGHLIDNPDEALRRGGALVQSAWGRLSGTDRPPADTGNAVDTVDTRDTIAPGLRNALAPAANTTYGSILPFARDQASGDVRLALPSSLRDLATGGLDLLEGPTTGTVTPAATSLLANAAIGGGLTPSLARGTGAAIRDTAELGAPAADLYRPRITATEVQARDGVGIMEAWNRAHAENNAAAIAKIGQATDIDGAIAAAGKAAEAPGAAAGNAAGTISPSVNVPAGTEAAPAGEVLGAGDLWRTDPEQLQAMLDEKGLSDRQKTVQALGSEAAAVEFYRLDRKQNSSDPQRADEGSREFEAKFGNLTPDQERLIYGVGETDAQADDIKQVLDAHSRISNDPTDAGYEAALAIRKVPAAEIMAVPEGNASPMAQAAYVRLKNAYGDMLDAGIAPDRVLSNIADALVKRGGWSPGDAAEVVGDFGEEMRRAAGTKATPAAQPRIAGPAATGASVTQSAGTEAPVAQAPTEGEPFAPTPVDGATSATRGTAVDATGAALSLIPKTSAEAKTIASAYYRRADQVGGTLLPEFTNKFIDKAESIAPQTPEGRAIAGDTAITGLVERIQALRDEPISLQGAQEIDERLGDLIDKEFGLKGLSKEGHDLLDLQTTFRNMILDAGPADAANGIEGFEAIKQGRLAWAQAMKMMDFERILNRAELTDNPVTSIRTGIRTLLSNPARVRGYSPEEIAALKDAANRGVIGSVLHVFGSRLTPLAVGAAGLSTGVIPGLIGAGVTHGLTSMMRSGATSLQMGRANRAMSVLGGGVPPPLP